MRVLQLGPYPPPHGGVQANLVAIRRYLLAREIPCEVINLTRHREAKAGGVHHPRSALQVLWLLMSLRYDVVHFHVGGNLTLRLLGLGLVCTLLPRRKAVLTFHSGGYPSSEAGRRARRASLTGYVLRRFDRVVAVNAEIADVLARFGVSPRRLRLIPPFAVDGAAVEAALPPSLSEFYGSHFPVLSSVGLLEPEYDLPRQIEMLGLLRRRHPGAGLVIIGSGSLEAELRRQIEATPYRDHLRLCGDVPHAATLRMIAASDLLLRTTLHDGDSVAVREALHLGTPVIATDNGMRPVGVGLIPVSDTAALHRAVLDVLERPAPREGRGAAGTENLQAILQDYEALAAELGHRPSPVAAFSTLLDSRRE